MNVVDITCEYKGSEESHQLFDSVSAAKVDESAGVVKRKEKKEVKG